MSYLYITEQGTTLKTNNGRFIVVKNEEILTEVPKETIETIALFGNIQITTQTIKECLIKGIAVTYYSTKGTYYGKLHSTSHINITKQKQQIKMTQDSQYCLGLTKQILKTKIHNQLTILRRYQRTHNVDVIQEINDILIAEKKIQESTTIPQAMGYEGIASRNYFNAINKILPPEFSFKGRTKQPPKDPFNSLISLGYTLLMYEIYGLLENKGLNPYAGFIHQDKERHPTLASDLMEEWRAIIPDTIAISLLTGNELTTEHFEKDEETGGILLTQDALKIFIKKYETKMRMELNYTEEKRDGNTYRKLIWKQVQKLAQSINEGNENIYEGIRAR